MFRSFKYLAMLAVVWFGAVSGGATAQEDGATAQEQTAKITNFDEAVFFFAGRFHSLYWPASFHPFSLPYENNYVLGVGYQKIFWQLPFDISVGGEIGFAGRFGQRSSAELWGGVVVRYDGFSVFEKIRVSPAVTFGLSAVTDTIGVEAVRAVGSGGTGGILLFYLGPEINISLYDRPDTEFFWRVQHRSGAWGTLAKLDGSNATVVGVRHRY